MRALVGVLEDAGARPFIVPAMGSHGGATAEGQVEILEVSGVTEESVGAPDPLLYGGGRDRGDRERGAGLHGPHRLGGRRRDRDRGRIKQHTDFRSDVESGLLKMASIGLGKHAQALALHAYGVKGIRDYMVEAGRMVFASGKVLFGVGIVENAYEETAIIEAIPPRTSPDARRSC